MRILHSILLLMVITISNVFYGENNNIKISADQNIEIEVCDDDSDGYFLFDTEEINNNVLTEFGSNNLASVAQVLISTSSGNILSVSSPEDKAKASISNLCTGNLGFYTDIAVDSNKQIFV